MASLQHLENCGHFATTLCARHCVARQGSWQWCATKAMLDDVEHHQILYVYLLVFIGGSFMHWGPFLFHKEYKSRDIWSSQAQARLKAATLVNQLRPQSDFDPLSIRFQAGFEANRIKSASKPDRKRLKIRSGSPLML